MVKWICAKCEAKQKAGAPTGYFRAHGQVCELCGAEVDRVREVEGVADPNAPAPPKPPACGDCRFFEHYDGNEGFCLRYPPAANPMSVENAICRPVVLLHEWCGEFQPKPLPVPPSETSKVRQTVIEGRNVGETAP